MFGVIQATEVNITNDVNETGSRDINDLGGSSSSATPNQAFLVTVFNIFDALCYTGVIKFVIYDSVLGKVLILERFEQITNKLLFNIKRSRLDYRFLNHQKLNQRLFHSPAPKIVKKPAGLSSCGPIFSHFMKSPAISLLSWNLRKPWPFLRT